MKKTIIGHDVRIGERAIIKQGVTIGTGAVIGMGSDVIKYIEPYSIVAGCPGRVIRKRFDDGIIIKLLEIKLWQFRDKRLLECAQYFTNPAEFIDMIGK